ncbi:hypothetical protein BJ165DRAFT_1406211 [Panaeolus papilionaceus]|nr:hypothetical protein BJ165DRAFT_1406205 [Panaeolus papilionaceus]KAF9041242.1 hypothetical protein BJ165DRAFT_1406211 [Panaeolus papilionaceus]
MSMPGLLISQQAELRKSKRTARFTVVLDDSDEPATDHESDVGHPELVNPSPPIPHYTKFIHNQGQRSPGQNFDAYCVWNGRKVGIFHSWPEVVRSTDNVPGAAWLGFATVDDAIQAWNSKVARKPDLAECARRQPFVEEDTAFYVVVRGARPGVYHGNVAAWNAAGPHSRARRMKSGSEAEAWKVFGQMYMSGKIEAL